MKFITLLFAILAAVPQALQQIALMFFKLYKCRPGAEICFIHDVNRARILNTLYQPNWFSTTGLRIGLVGTALGMLAMYAIGRYNRMKAEAIINKAHDHKLPVQPPRSRDVGGRRAEQRPVRDINPRNPLDHAYNDRHSGLDYNPDGRYIGRSRRPDDENGPRRR